MIGNCDRDCVFLKCFLIVLVGHAFCFFPVPFSCCFFVCLSSDKDKVWPKKDITFTIQCMMCHVVIEQVQIYHDPRVIIQQTRHGILLTGSTRFAKPMFPKTSTNKKEGKHWMTKTQNKLNDMLNWVGFLHFDENPTKKSPKPMFPNLTWQYKKVGLSGLQKTRKNKNCSRKRGGGAWFFFPFVCEKASSDHPWVQAEPFHWLHEVFIFKIVCHDFQIGLININ